MMVLTENGAVTYDSTGSHVLNFFASGAAMRADQAAALEAFKNAFFENERLALMCLFYIRDVRGGAGEREIFRTCLRWLHDNHVDVFEKIIPFVPQYGRWDDILIFVNNNCVVEFVQRQLYRDVVSDSPSLLAKWMPSANTSSVYTRALAQRWQRALSVSPMHYRKMLSNLRKRLRVVEQQMSAQAWDEIDYSAVPSRAALIYKNAFKKHDPERYDEYITAVGAGERSINAGALYPYDIIHALKNDPSNATLEMLWKALPNYIDTGKNVIAVVDVSGSMFVSVNGKKGVTAVNVAVSLGIYTAERLPENSAFHRAMITFSNTPTIVQLRGETLLEMVQSTERIAFGYNTNLQAVFECILRAGIDHTIPQAGMPEIILVISDMEFDPAGMGATNFDSIRVKYAEAGYNMPVIAFWDVMARNTQFPSRQLDENVLLFSGLSPAILKLALNGQSKTPVEFMLDTLRKYEGIFA